MSRLEVEVERHEGHLLVRWADARATGSCRFDHIAGSSPEWLGSADELLEGADRRQEARILDALAKWASGAGVEIGIWHHDAGVELLV